MRELASHRVSLQPNRNWVAAHHAVLDKRLTTDRANRCNQHRTPGQMTVDDECLLHSRCASSSYRQVHAVTERLFRSTPTLVKPSADTLSSAPQRRQWIAYPTPRFRRGARQVGVVIPQSVSPELRLAPMRQRYRPARRSIRVYCSAGIEHRQRCNHSTAASWGRTLLT